MPVAAVDLSRELYVVTLGSGERRCYKEISVNRFDVLETGESARIELVLQSIVEESLQSDGSGGARASNISAGHSTASAHSTLPTSSETALASVRIEWLGAGVMGNVQGAASQSSLPVFKDCSALSMRRDLDILAKADRIEELCAALVDDDALQSALRLLIPLLGAYSSADDRSEHKARRSRACSAGLVHLVVAASLKGADSETRALIAQTLGILWRDLDQAAKRASSDAIAALAKIIEEADENCRLEASTALDNLAVAAAEIDEAAIVQLLGMQPSCSKGHFMSWCDTSVGVCCSKCNRDVPSGNAWVSCELCDECPSAVCLVCAILPNRSELTGRQIDTSKAGTWFVSTTEFENLRVRAGPSLQAATIGLIPQGGCVDVSGFLDLDGGWVKLVDGGGYMYTSNGDYLTRLDAESPTGSYMSDDSYLEELRDVGVSVGEPPAMTDASFLPEDRSRGAASLRPSPWDPLPLSNRSEDADAQAMREALALEKRLLGPGHPETLTTASNLASYMLRQGQFAQAAEMFREVLQAKQHVLGAEDEETLSLTRDLAHCLRKQGKHLEAEAYNRPVSVRAQASQFTDSSESIAIA